MVEVADSFTMSLSFVVTVCPHYAHLRTFSGRTTSFFEIVAGLYLDLLQPHLVGVPLAVQATWRRKGRPADRQKRRLAHLGQEVGLAPPRPSGKQFRLFAPATRASPGAESCAPGPFMADGRCRAVGATRARGRTRAVDSSGSSQHGPCSNAGSVALESHPETDIYIG